MLCIPTLVTLCEGDLELDRAWTMVRLRVIALGASPGCLPTHRDGGGWRYLASTPFREDDGEIAYVHVFRFSGEGEVRALGVPATPGWWPAGHRTLAPRRTPSRAKLRLVS